MSNHKKFINGGIYRMKKTKVCNAPPGTKGEVLQKGSVVRLFFHTTGKIQIDQDCPVLIMPYSREGINYAKPHLTTHKCSLGYVLNHVPHSLSDLHNIDIL